MRTPRIALVNADPQSANRGVKALFATTIAGVTRRMPVVDWTVIDSFLGRRRTTWRVDDGEPVPMTLVGGRTGNRYYRPENYATMSILQRLGPIGAGLSPTLRGIRDADVLLDASGGDSFTDLYGTVRWEWTVQPKRIALRGGTPLVMLPKTFGPFDRHRDEAASLVRRSEACWARDGRSFEVLRDLLGPEFDPDRHRQGVDMAFGLAVIEPEASEELSRIAETARGPVVGLNVSGLMYNDPDAARDRYGFKADYRRVVDRFLERILEETDATVLLVPHVMAPSASVESDPGAAEAVVAALGQAARERVSITPSSLDQSEVKWLISRCDWFCGTRMHATIAGLSTCTPTATVSYSGKAIGVFESCGQGGEVFDPRDLDTEAIVERMMDSYGRREDLRTSLEREMPGVKAIASRQMDEIVAVVESCVSAARRI